MLSVIHERTWNSLVWAQDAVNIINIIAFGASAESEIIHL